MDSFKLETNFKLIPDQKQAVDALVKGVTTNEPAQVLLGVVIADVLLIILVFSFYVSVAKDLPFWRRFLEMAGISLGVAALSFGIGYFVRLWLGVDI